MSEKLDRCPICGNTIFLRFLDVEDLFLSKEFFSIQKCDSCGFKFINPRPDQVEIDRYYQSKEYVSHDANRVTFINQIYKLVRGFSIKNKYKIVKENVSEGKILDIGCGTGEFLGYCSSMGFDVEGVEPSIKARSYAQQVNSIPVTENLTDLKSRKETFSCVSMWHVLEHIHDLNDTIEQVKGLLSPNGIFIVAVPNCNSWDAQKYGKFWAAYDVPRHLYHFNRTTLNQLISNHGFEIVKIIPQKLDAFYISMLSEKYLTGRKRYFKFLIFGLWSNIQARKQGIGHSSQIFVLSLKKT